MAGCATIDIAFEKEQSKQAKDRVKN